MKWMLLPATALVVLAGCSPASDRGDKAAGGTADTSADAVTQLARALQGLTLDDAGHAVRRALSARKALDASSIPALLEEIHLGYGSHIN